MEISLVTCRQEMTATRFRLPNKYRYRSLYVEESCGWKWRDSSL